MLGMRRLPNIHYYPTAAEEAGRDHVRNACTPPVWNAEFRASKIPYMAVRALEYILKFTYPSLFPYFVDTPFIVTVVVRLA